MLPELKTQDMLRASSVKRWGTVETTKEQDVAQHSYNVAHISRAFVLQLTYHDEHLSENEPLQSELMRYSIEWALLHDVSEVLTGDIPTPFKAGLRVPRGSFESRTVTSFEDSIPGHIRSDVRTIVKFADLLCAARFMNKYAPSGHGAVALRGIKERINELIQTMGDLYGPVWSRSAISVYSEVVHGKETYL